MVVVVQWIGTIELTEFSEMMIDSLFLTSLVTGFVPRNKGVCGQYAHYNDSGFVQFRRWTERAMRIGNNI